VIKILMPWIAKINAMMTSVQYLNGILLVAIGNNTLFAVQLYSSLPQSLEFSDFERQSTGLP